MQSSPLAWHLSNLHYPFLRNPGAKVHLVGPCARVSTSTVLPLTLFSSQGDFAATFWLAKAIQALLLLA